jgi:RNA polymerase sigma-70 factor, ECF subfamily
MLLFYLSLIDDDETGSFFEQIYNEHRFTMLAAANKLLNDQQLAEDAVHEAFLRIIKHLDKIRDFECNKMRSYFVIVVRNIAMDWLRKRRHHENLNIDDYDEILTDSRPLLDEAFLDEERAEVMLKAIQSMPPSYLDALSLKMVYGFSGRQIARMLQTTEAAIRVRIYRGRKMLIAKLEEGEPNGQDT